MATVFTQANRNLEVVTSLGKDVFLLAGFAGKEQISGLFEFELEMWSEEDGIAAKDIVGKSVTFSVGRADGDPRCFNGVVSRFSAGVRRDELRHYRAEVVPALWFLTRTTDCRIFQNLSVPEIVEKVLKDHGVTDYKTSGIKGKHPKLEYCVQYRETDFDFISRLLEREGIFYFFAHEDGKHTLVLADDNSAFQDNPRAEVEYSYSANRQSHVNRITQWEHRYEFRAGKWAQTDYNFIEQPAATVKVPSGSLMSKADGAVKLTGNAKFEKYDYPGEYEVKGDGTNYTKVRMQEEEVPHHQVFGCSRCVTFEPGSKFKVTGHDCAGEDGKTYILTSVIHRAQEGSAYRMTGGDGAIEDYENQFICVPQDVPYRAPRTTPQPRIDGTQTAVVVGPAGEEIWPDKFGRVKVQFYWDREGVRDENSSCWIRCAQGSAGKNWGSMFIPRVGQEVVVTYLEGNPDRPLITGVVYNADQMPAYALPDEKTKSYIKTNSSPDGKGYNEIRLEDMKDKEQIFIHAQKDLDIRVLNDRKEHVINDRHLVVGNDEDGKKGSDYQMVFVNREIDIKGDQIEHLEGNWVFTIGKGDNSKGGNADITVEKNVKHRIEGDHDFKVKGDEKYRVSGDASLSIAGDNKQEVDGDLDVQVGGDHSVKIDGDDSLDLGGDFKWKAGKGFSLELGKDHQEKVGGGFALEAAKDVYLKGANIVIEAGTQLTLKVGGNFVVIDAGGVAIKGAAVKLNSGGSAGSGTAPSPQAPTAPADPDEPEKPKLAKPKVPAEADNSVTGAKSAPDSLS